MGTQIGLHVPLGALFLFALLFLPIFNRHYPQHGIGSVFFSPQFFFLCASLVIFRLRKLCWTDIGVQKQKSLLYFGFGAGIGLMPIFLLLGIFFLGIFPRETLVGAPLPLAWDGYQFFLLVFLAPLSEEIFFRGILFTALRENYSNWISVLLSSVIFMAGHAGGGPSISIFGLHFTLSIGPFILGLIASGMMIKTGSIFPGLGLHMVSNTYSPILILWFPNFYRQISFLFP